MGNLSKRAETANAGIQCFTGDMDASICWKNVYVQQNVGAAAGSFANGATGAMLGGFASGAVGSWASGDEGWWDMETSEKGEYELIDDETTASKMKFNEGKNTNTMRVGSKVGSHGHGPNQPDFTGDKSGPSGMDLISTARIEQTNSNYKSWVMDATINKIHQYNGNGIDVTNVDFNNPQEVLALKVVADFHAQHKLNIVQTVDYVPKVTYKTYYSSHFSW